MTPPSGSSFLLASLFILASGYIIHSAPICRFWISKSTGYILYFRIITTSLIFLLLFYFLFYAAFALMFGSNAIIAVDPSLSRLMFEANVAPVQLFLLGAFCFSLILRGCAYCVVRWIIKGDLLYDLNLKTFDEKGLDQLVYKRMYAGEMIMLTLDSNKVYVGWPIEAPDPGSEDDKWLRIVPQLSGYRDEKYKVVIQRDYTKLSDYNPFEYDPMLIAVEKIVTAQPFDIDIFEKLNSKS